MQVVLGKSLTWFAFRVLKRKKINKINRPVGESRR